MAEPTRAQVQAEADRLRIENENLRYVNQCLLDAARCCTHDAEVHKSAAAKHYLEAIRVFTMPTIPNN